MSSGQRSRTGIASADLSITKTDAPDPVTAGAALTYTLTVSNAGPSTAAAPISVTDSLPPGVTFQGASGAGWTCSGTNTSVACTRASTLPPGAAPPITILVTAPNEGSTITNTASVSSSTSDPNSSNNTATASTTVIASADLSITKTDAPDPVTAGATLTYTLTVSNAGPSTAAAPINVTDSLPPGVTFQGASGAGWTCSGTNTSVACTRASTLPPGAAPPITILVTAPNEGSTITNTASVSSSTSDPNSSNNTATASTTVIASADLSITTTEAPAPVPPGAALPSTLTVSNAGPSTAAAPISVTDSLPPGVTFQGASGAGWTCSGTNTSVACTRASTLPPGAAPPITILVTAPNEGSTITNAASVSSSTSDPNSSNNTATASTTVIASADLSITKTDAPDPVSASAPLTYTLTVSNAGPSTAAAPISVTDSLPPGVTFQGASGAGWTCSGTNTSVACTRASTLPPGAAPPITILVTAPNEGSTITNTASVSSSSSDPDSSNNTATASTTVIASADLSITKTDAPDPVRPGENLTYTLVVNNNGPSTAASVTVTDPLPPVTTFQSIIKPAGWTCTTPAVGSAGTVSCTTGSTA